MDQHRAARRLAGFLIENQQAERYGRFLAQLETETVMRLIRPEAIEAVGEYDPLWWFKERFARAAHLDRVNQILYTDFSTRLADTYLEKVDKATMAVGLEARVPFLDHELAEAAFQIPGSQKIVAGITKYPLKRAMVGILPMRTLVRPKHGFSVPTDECSLRKRYCRRRRAPRRGSIRRSSARFVAATSTARARMGGRFGSSSTSSFGCAVFSTRPRAPALDTPEAAP